MSQSVPATIGKYQVIREIARSNDIVYEAYDPLMNRRVAIKELAVPGGSTPTQREDRIKRFQREVKAAGSLAHPNIVTIYEVGEDAGRHFMAMEYLDGHTLRNEIDTRGGLTVTRAIEVAIDVLCALNFAHEHGVIHRDVKPDNIQILENGTVKLTDFGIARLTFEPSITMDGQVFGTPSYMSPEQVVGREIDLRSDIFSMGVVLYEMLTGNKPFSGDSVVAITYAIMNQRVEPHPQIGFSVQQVLDRALDKSPQLRYSSAKDMAEGLQGALVSLSGPAPAAAPSFSPPTAMGGTIAGPPPMLLGGGPQTYGQAPMQPDPYAAQGYQTQYQPYGQPAYPPAPQYGYGAPQPYGSPPYDPNAAYGMQPQGYPQSLPTGQIPVYYPPAPRKPLFTREAKLFWLRVLLTVAIVGSLLGLIFVAVAGASKAYSETERQKKDIAYLESRRNQIRELPPQEQIKALKEEVLPGVESEQAKADVKKEIGDLHAQEAKTLEAQQRFGEAEVAYTQAVNEDPNNAEHLYEMGGFYQDQANRASNSLAERFGYLLDAARSIGRASQLTTDSTKRSQWGERSGNLFNNLIDMLVEDPSVSTQDTVVSLADEGLKYVDESSRVATRLKTKRGLGVNMGGN